MKDKAIQIIRVCAMVFIVMFHCVCYYGVWGSWFPTQVKYSHITLWCFVCSIALTAFVFISGILYGSYLNSYTLGGGGKTTLIKRKLNRLAIPYFAWGLLILLIFPDLSTIGSFFSGVHHLWFLLMMTVIFIVVILIGKNILKPQILITLFLLFYVANFATNRYLSGLPNYIAWKSSIHYMPAFLCGIAITALNLSDQLNKLKARIFNCTTIALTLLVASLCLPLPAKAIFSNAIIYAWLIFIYTLLRYKIKIRGESRIINSFDRHSMTIYIIHHIIIWCVLVYVPPTIPFMEKHYIIAPIILFTCIFLVSWAIASISSKNKYTNYLFTGKLNHHSAER